jgi:hypothetical protein
MACRCGAESCRRLITGQDWQKPELQQKYGSYFAWYLLEKIRAERSAKADDGRVAGFSQLAGSQRGRRG